MVPVQWLHELISIPGNLDLIKDKLTKLALSWGCTARQDVEGNLVIAKSVSPALPSCTNALQARHSRLREGSRSCYSVPRTLAGRSPRAL